MPKYRNTKTGATLDLPAPPGPEWEPAGEDNERRSVIPRGTLKPLGGIVHQWDGDRWVSLGIPASEDASDLTYEQQVALASTPRTSISQSIADPASLQLQRDQLAATIKAREDEAAREQQKFQFEQDQARVANERGNAQLALQHQQIAESIAARLQANAIQREQMQQSLTLADRSIAQQRAEMEQRQQEAAASRSLAREGMATQDAAARRGEQLRRDEAIAQYATNPGDVGRVSALLNREGYSPISTAIGQGETAVTDRSLEPLAALMAPDVQSATPAVNMNAPDEQFPEYTKAQAQNFINQNPNWRANMATGRGMAALQQAQNQPPPAPPQSPASGPPDTAALRDAAFLSDAINSGRMINPAERAAANAEMKKQGVPSWVPRFEDGGAVVEPDILNGLMAMVRMMGLEPKGVAGERGEASGETVYADPDANVVIAPDRGKGAQDKPHMQGGGMLSPLIELARQFMQRTGQTALARGGFDTTPTPVSLADPGTSPFRRRLGAATAATTTGIPQDVFLNELMRAIPRGMPFGTVGRTR